ncbi:chondroitin AC/alginate lyase [Hortaea werneckii]|uniref:Alginate lyase domain-containing protein n=1 Tax=Hortaea werneckii TaxID=91943 RepID=A0A3M6ZND5_HORWE|nr:chondroitin AC/alginate lyase [Hortaea werneckii]KAI7027282.1 chondroitin AC/alginate lyase [Hortaea werneckii]KAI7676128.1 chondroitin AC/alginate lyase [Hortaea werneckii]RMY16681.1 hypothetical protein D0868_00199 [Hortaea werneckii]RMY21648.1 hypothetical protein D0867_03208 [Hortaea werneckii]
MFALRFLSLIGSATACFVHPGALHTAEDIERVKGHVSAGEEPWSTAFRLLEQNEHAQTSWTPSATSVIIRGDNGEDPQNYANAFRDAAASYQLALRWLISGNTSYADASVDILNAWSSTLEDIDGTSDKYLASGLYGYQFANAAELMRSYKGWTTDDQNAFGTMLTDIFARFSRRFLDEHNDADRFHYYANWDQANIACLLAVGIFTDNRTMYDHARDYVLHGESNGALPFFSIANYTEEGSGKLLMQGQEAGRDQGHTLLDFALLGVIAQQGYNQGDDLFAAYSNEILNGAEYAAKYNVNQSVPYTPYESFEGTQTVISPDSRADIRPGFELLVAHYGDVAGLNASWSAEYRDYVNENTELGVEGGGGDYSPNSGGYDALGYGTLMYRRSA